MLPCGAVLRILRSYDLHCIGSPRQLKQNNSNTQLKQDTSRAASGGRDAIIDLQRSLEARRLQPGVDK